MYDSRSERETEPVISIIVPIHNAEFTLERCLQSIRKQSYPNMEILLIDDGSTDAGRAICQRYTETDRRFRLFLQDNKGVSAARNLGLEKAAGTYVLFVDSDDSLKENYVKRLWEILNAESVDLVVCDYQQESGKTEERDISHYAARPGTYGRKDYIDRISRCPGAHYFGVLWNKIYRVDLLKKKQMRFHPELSMGEDFVFNMEYISLVDRICVIEDKLYIYSCNNPDSLSHRKKTVEKRIEERIRLYQAYAGLFKRENLERCWKYKLHYYVLKAYFEETKILKEEEKKYKPQFYQAYIRNCGIGRAEFCLCCLLRWWKRMLNIRIH